MCIDSKDKGINHPTLLAHMDKIPTDVLDSVGLKQPLEALKS